MAADDTTRLSSMPNELNFAKLRRRIGKEIHVSDWISVSQREIDMFGKVTRDLDPIHVNPKFAKTNGPFGGPVLFGFQILSMLSHLCQPLRFKHESGKVGYDLNYGMNRVRFISPIPVNALFRNHVVLKKVDRRKNGDYLLTTVNTIELQGNQRPALVAEWIGLISRERTPSGAAQEKPLPRATRP
jgi:acyl dehydratase